MSKYAIIESGSKQYRVEPNKEINVELLNLEENSKSITLDRVLFYQDGERVEVGKPVIPNAKVVCDYLGDFRDKKVIAFTYRRRKNSRKIRGHRQGYSKLLIKEIKV